MAREFARKFYKSKEWRNLRTKYINSRFNICERCGGIGKIVHHKIYITPRNLNDPNVTLNWDNLELLCQDCHNNEHMSTDRLENNLMFDEMGNIIKKK